ncbi:hypothetical protein BH09ACT10_BH09ACT10_02010 [soil metagenome]
MLSGMTSEAATKTESIRRRWVLGSVALVVSLVLVVGAVVGYQGWWSRPTAFSGWGNVMMSTTSKVGQTLTVGMDNTYPGEDVNVHSAKPVVRVNSADAKIELLVCHYRSAEKQLGSIFGSLDEYCSSTSPVDGYDLRKTANKNEAILARITPRKPGSVRIDGLNVHYMRGWRHAWQTGTEQMGMEVRLKAQ